MGKDQELMQAVKAEDVGAVQKLLQRPKPGKAKLLGSTKRVNVNFQDTDGFSALHHAALNGNTELILLLLEAQAAVDIKDNKGMRPLHYAAWQGKKEPMKLVLKAGSSVNIPSDEGQIPLHLAAQHGHYDVEILQHPLCFLACQVVQLLLNSNMCAALLEPKPGDITDPNGTSPLHLAAKNGHIDVIRLLLQAGIDINRQTKAGTALHEAALCGKTDVVRLLLDSGINAHIRNTYSQTALDIVHQFTATQASKEIKQMLQKSLQKHFDWFFASSLPLPLPCPQVLEQHADGRWKGCIHDNRTGNDRVGYFPSTLVEAISKRTGSRGSDASPSHLSPGSSASTPAPAEEIWVLRKPFAGRRRKGGSWGQCGEFGQWLLKSTPLQAMLAGEFWVLKSTPLQATKVEKHWLIITLCPSQANLALWLSMIGLAQYYKVLVENGYENIDFITDITWEDLQEIGIIKLGHQKKLMLAVKKLAEIQKAEYIKYESGTLKKKGAPQSQDTMAIESPPQETAECQSPKMSTFQDSELSNELQVAMTGTSEEGPEKQANHVTHFRDGAVYRHPSRLVHENSLSGRAKLISSSQELLGDGLKSPGPAASKSQEHLAEEGKEPPATLPKEVRSLRHGHSIKRASVPPVPGKPRQSFPPAAGHYTPPQTPTKPRPSSPQAFGAPHATAKVKPTPQLLPQTDRPMSPRSLPQSPTHRGFAYVLPQPVEGEAQAAGPLAQAVPVLPISIPVLCLPPQAAESEEEAGRPKKRAHSLNRYAVSDSEQERDELMVPDAGPYATVQRRVGRSHSVRAQSGADKNVNRSQSFAVRPKKKGPPPPPPKRSSSAISSNNMADDFSKEGEEGEELDQKQLSDGGTIETGSAGSVKSIAAMLEMSSIGGGGRALALQKGADGYYLQPGVVVRSASPEHARVATVLATVKHKEAIGPDGEVVNRRRTISGPVTGLVAAARRERSDSIKSDTVKDGGPIERLRAEHSGSAPDLSRVEASATLKRRIRAKQCQQDNVKFILTESDTVKRRPKSKDKEQELAQLSVYHNGMGTVKHRPTSEMSSLEAVAPTEQQERVAGASVQIPREETKKPIKPPVSPKPILPPKTTGPSTPTTKRAPIPGPGSPEVKRVHGTAPPTSPKPTPPPTAPKPKVHPVLQSVSASCTPAPSPAKQLTPTIKPSSTPPSLCSSPAKPLSPGGQPPQTVPVKPPRSSMAGPSVESTESVHQKLEETSASLAAALQAVEEKIKQEDGQAADSAAESKSTVSILDDIGSMFDDLADQLDAMLE
uniref:CASK interacting protein 1 n=1 Tax=Naja naja TaxID=35670 RepID=A0A8C6Y3H3_NAJNA